MEKNRQREKYMKTGVEAFGAERVRQLFSLHGEKERFYTEGGRNTKSGPCHEKPSNKKRNHFVFCDFFVYFCVFFC